MGSHGHDQKELQRQLNEIKRYRWYRCHGCGAEYSIKTDGVRNSAGCLCPNPDVHVHSDLDGEVPNKAELQMERDEHIVSEES